MRISDWSSDVCSSDLQKWRDGIAVEMQEGGGKAYLPEVLAKLDEDPDAFCILPMTNRVMQVRLDADTGVLEAIVLRAGQGPLEDYFRSEACRGVKGSVRSF